MERNQKEIDEAAFERIANARYIVRKEQKKGMFAPCDSDLNFTTPVAANGSGRRLIDDAEIKDRFAKFSDDLNLAERAVRETLREEKERIAEELRAAAKDGKR